MDPISKSPEQISDTLAELCDAERLEEAHILAEQALVHYPHHPQLLSDTGAIALQRGDNALAIRCFEQATKLAPDSPEILRNYLVSLDQIGDYEKIAAKSQEILRHFGDQIEILKSAALACRKAAADDNFFELLRRLHELEPRERLHLEAIANYADIQGRTAEQLFAAELLWEFSPDDLSSLLRCFHLSNISGHQEKREQYRRLVQSAASANPEVNAEFIGMLLHTMEHIKVWPLFKHQQRLHQLFDLFNATADLSGEIAECGVFRGFSTLMICQFQLGLEPGFDGTGYHVFDSFQGLSEAEEEDLRAVDQRTKKMMYAGNFACSEENFRRSIVNFPGVAVYPGWIPERFSAVRDLRFKFVHVDVDLARPTYDSFAFFYPRLVSGGVILTDDGSWPATRQAIERFATEAGITQQNTAAGQIVLTKP